MLKIMDKKFIFLAVFGIVIISLFFFGNNSPYKGNDDNTLRRAILGDPESLDPNYAKGTWEGVILTDVFAGLLCKDAKGESFACMAESWSVNDTKDVYTFKLRDSKWSDGVQVTAHDFVYSYLRMLNPETAAPYADLLYIIKGAKSYNSGETSVDSVKIKALDNKTLRIELEKPISYFLSMLHHYSFYPIPKHVVEKHGREWSKLSNIVNNGAYKIVEWTPKAYVKSSRNEFYYDNHNTKIDNVIYYTQEDRTAVLKRFRSGEIDISLDFASDQYEWIVENLPGQYDTSPYLGTYYFVINATNEKLSDKRVREAINLAIDRKFITENVLQSGERPAYSLIPSDIKRYQPAELYFKDIPKEERINKAKLLLKEAGYDENNPLHIEISYNSSDNHKKVSIAIANMLKEIGINYTLVNVELSVHFANINSSQFEMARAGWVADFDDPYSFLYVGLSNNPNNYGKFSNKEFDDYINKSMETFDEKERNNYYQAAEQILLDSSIFIPVYYLSGKNLFSDRIEGFYANINNVNPSQFISIKETETK